MISVDAWRLEGGHCWICGYVKCKGAYKDDWSVKKVRLSLKVEVLRLIHGLAQVSFTSNRVSIVIQKFTSRH